MIGFMVGLIVGFSLGFLVGAAWQVVLREQDDLKEAVGPQKTATLSEGTISTVGMTPAEWSEWVAQADEFKPRRSRRVG